MLGLLYLSNCYKADLQKMYKAGGHPTLAGKLRALGSQFPKASQKITRLPRQSLLGQGGRWKSQGWGRSEGFGEDKEIFK